MSPRSPSPRGPQSTRNNVFQTNYQAATQRADRSYYKKLYHFNADVELAEFSLPVTTQQSPTAAGRHGRTPSGVVNTVKLPPLQQQQQTIEAQPSQFEEVGRHPIAGTLEYDMMTGQQMDQEMGMDGYEGHMAQMDDEMDREEYDAELADQVEDDLGYEEFTNIVEATDDTAGKDNLGDLRKENFIRKGTAIWHLQQSIKTGEQAISFFAKHGSNMPIKFLNCNRRQVPISQFRPYDLVVIENDKELESEYFTISAQGVVQVFQENLNAQKKISIKNTPTEFLSLSEWMQQSTMYNVLTSMNFFKNYLIGKVFRLWRGNVRYRVYNRTRKDLSKALIYTRPDYLPCFMEVNQLLFEMQAKSTFYIKKNQSHVEIEEFQREQQGHHETVKAFYKEKVEENVKASLVQLIKEIEDSRSLKDEDEMDNTKKGKAEKKKSLVVEKQNKAVRNQVITLARMNFKSLGTFIRLIDYRVIETQVRINQEGADLIISEMDNAAKKYFIQTDADFSPDVNITTLQFATDADSFVDTFQRLLREMQQATEDVQPINTQQELQQYISGLITEGAPRFKAIAESSFAYSTTKQVVEDRLRQDIQYLKEKTADFEKCHEVYAFMQSFKFEDFAEDNVTVEPIRELFQSLLDWDTGISKYVKVYESKGLVLVNGRKLRDQLQTRVKAEQANLRQHLYGLALKTNTEIQHCLNEIDKNINRPQKSLGEYVDYVKALRTSREMLASIDGEKQKLEAMKGVLGRFRNKEETGGAGGSQNIQNLQSKIDSINLVLETKKQQLDDCEAKAKDREVENAENLVARIEDEKEKLEDHIKKVQSENLMSKDFATDQALKELRLLKKRFDETLEKITLYQSYEETMNIEERVPVPQVDIFNKLFTKRETLWKNRDNFRTQEVEWYAGQFRQQDAKAIAEFVKDLTVQNMQMKIKLAKDEEDQVLEAFTEEVNRVNEHVPLIVALGNKAMRKKHWEKVYKKLGVPYPELDSGFTFQSLINDGVEKFKSDIEEISGFASGEEQIENDMTEIKTRWEEETDFTVVPYRDSNNYSIIKEVEDVIEQLENDSMKISTLLGSKHVKDIREDVESWERKLGYISYVIDEWLTFQKSWMYLENIFSAEDIQAQLKTETQQFKAVDKFWTQTMDRTKRNPKVVAIFDEKGSNLKVFIESNKKLDEIQKGLEDYLETKRSAFPRFYFLSNDELIEILSQTRNVHAVQPHLAKCFDAIKKVEFTPEPDSKEIVGMFSPEGEFVQFSDSVFAEGPVEHWLSKIEAMMIQTLYDRTKMALNQYPEDGSQRDEWLFSFCAQPILTVDMVTWTANATKAIETVAGGTDAQALAKFLQFSDKQLNNMINLVRTKITKLQRIMLGALIVLDVHAMVIIKDYLIKNRVDNINAFDWTSQLRYYWEDIGPEDGIKYDGEDVDKDCFAKQTNTRFRYGYEYLGNGPRLVITPLTDKCYMTLTGALHSNYGGNPQGPAGTGKTETTKDLAKALAIQCVVFNCSDGLDAKMMGRFFVGLASGGAWSCFDEFNRIFIEVLSVIAQQILTIQSAVKAKLSEFEFEDKIIPLNLRFGVFITMNPGYAGRTELPDNLKALFRPISMMIPDYQLIAQIILYSEGFESAVTLSQKMVKLYSLASEQLSKQDHYDFGMRAVKSVLVMAGQLKRKDDTVPEDILLIRAMRDSNVPKFLEIDLPLFSGIIQDLFPGIDVPYIDYGLLQKQIEAELRKDKLQIVPAFITKIIQLLETAQVRHGNMLVGSTGVGKSTCSHILSKALTQLHKDGHQDDWYKPVVIKTLNPKAVTLGELFGETNPFTNEWTEGIVSSIFQDAVQALEGEQGFWKRWILFDGPVDTGWIESMNTVLDDNKMLCLNNGQRIKMPETCTMMFEVNDLKAASPATVSRCGMVFIEPVHLGWEPLIETWFERMKGDGEGDSIICEEFLPKIREVLMGCLQKLLTIVRKQREVIPSVDSNLVSSCLKLVQLFLNKEAIKLDDKEKIEDPETTIATYVAFSVIWSLGANLHEACRLIFGSYLKSEIGNHMKNFPDGEVYDYGINPETHRLEKWNEQLPEYKFDPAKNFFDILVPTTDTVKYNFLLTVLLTSGSNVLLMGETGVGKSVIVKDFLVHAPEQLIYAFVNFSGKTSTKNMCDSIEGNLDAIRKNKLQPKAGKKMVFFIDDVNMPQLDRYGSQPPIELLRQIIDQGGYYDTKKLLFKYVAETRFVAACAPPSGGRNPVTPRLFRHFNMIWVPELSASSMRTIFTSILKGYLAQRPESGLSLYAETIIKCSVEIYLKSVNQFLPTPTKCHYTFNLRDLSKVVQGMLMCKLDHIESKEYLVELYICETFRVFRDRLIDETDRKKFNDLNHTILEHYAITDQELEAYQNILFGDVENPEKDYIKLSEQDELLPKLQEQLEFYNTQHQPMNLVFFEDCIQHLARIARILRQQRGNAMLVGVGGSGRRSMAMLAAGLNGISTMQIEISKNYRDKEFQEDIRKLLKNCALEDEKMQFLFSDTQIVKESFLEDINNLLNTGEIPNLFGAEEKQAIVDELMDKARGTNIQPTKDALYAWFVDMCRERLHIVLAFSPVGESFRDRCRQFPSIINCATIDWYSAWPEEALNSVAHRAYSAVSEQLAIKDDLEVLAKASVNLHQTVRAASDAFYDELRRKNYVTPTSYLELVDSFVAELKRQQQNIPVAIARFEKGLTRLAETNVIVEELKENLVELAPKIDEKETQVKAMIVNLTQETKVASEQEKVTAKDEAEARKIHNEVSQIKASCEEILDQAMPALKAATDSLSCLEAKDISEISKYAVPPQDLVMVLNAVCLLKGEKQDWDTAKKLMKDPRKFIDDLVNFKKDDIKEATLKKLKKFINDPAFVPKNIAKKSEAGKSICMWVRAMDTYSEVLKVVVPKKAALKKAEGELEAANADLKKKQAELQVVRDKIAKLEFEYNSAQQELDKLSEQKKTIEVQLGRADKLVVGLADESKRWAESIEDLKKDKVNMLGDSVLAAGYISYLGCFTRKYRDGLVQEWQKFLKANKLPYSDDFSVQKVLGDPVLIRDWQMKGLPGDTLSTDNGIISTSSKRWPLIIDPQSQGNRWIKNMEKENNLQVIKLSNPKFLNICDTSIRLGYPVLLENIGETLDPSLEPILQKNIIKTASGPHIKLGDQMVPYRAEFKFFMTTKMANPHYLPEICIKVTLINFTVTPDGLEDQLLVEVVKFEQPEIEAKKDQLIVTMADFQRQLKEIETKILKLVSEATEDILNDEELIIVLDQSKQTSIQIGERMVEAEQTSKVIQETRESYRPVAIRGSVLYFVIADLALIDPMYQYSLEFFMNLFKIRLDRSEASEDLKARLEILVNDVTKSFYESICRGLFERDKLLYSFLITSSVLRRDSKITDAEWNFFLRGSTTNFADKENGASDLIGDEQYQGLWGLEESHVNFEGIVKSIEGETDKLLWMRYLKSENPQKEVLPKPYADTLNSFQKGMLVKILSNMKMMGGIKEFVRDNLGEHYIVSPPFDLEGSLNDSSNVTPIIFVLSPGADPIAYLIALAEAKGMSDKFRQISLGQGQNFIAEKLIKEGQEHGMWICLQNCHLYTSWMGELEKIQEKADPEAIDPAYRLWLTSDPSPHFPVPILQSGIKLTNEPPKGLRANMARTFNDLGAERYEECTKPREYKKLVFALAYFHSAILERRKYGAIGWNIAYQWMNSDFDISEKQLMMYLNEQPDVPYQALNYLVAEVNYGGRVTDEKDGRCMRAMLKKYFTPEVMQDGYKFSKLETYYAPSEGSFEEALEAINRLPLEEDPEVFGLHNNANMTYESNTVQFFMDTVLKIQPRISSSSAAKSPEELIKEMAEKMKAELPDNMDKSKAHEKTFAKSEAGVMISLGVFVGQEIERFNKLLTVIRKNLQDLADAIEGTVVMSQELELMFNSFMDGKVPERWLSGALGYPSLKPLAAWMADLIKRIEFMSTWLYEGPPLSFWLSCFFFPQGFMTATLQTYARDTKTAIDTLSFRTNVLERFADSVTEAPETGVNIHGLFMQGAKWDYVKMAVEDSDPKVALVNFPVIWLEPVLKEENIMDGTYECPLYKTSLRAGELSTTGHSTNFVLFINLPSKVQADHWIRRGTALLCMTDY